MLHDWAPGQSCSTDWSIGTDPSCTNQTFAESHESYKMFVPLKFWFCNPDMSLHIGAMKYTQFTVEFLFRSLDQMVVGLPSMSTSTAGSPSVPNLAPTGGYASGRLAAQLLVACHYLPKEYRHPNLPAQQTNFLITKMQNPVDSSVNTSNVNLSLTELHSPVKDLTFMVQTESVRLSGRVFDYTCASTQAPQPGTSPIKSASLVADNYEIVTQKNYPFFSLVQYSARAPSIPSRRFGLNTLFFCLFPRDTSPSGSFNFSPLKTASLRLQLEGIQSSDQARARVYATSYDVITAMDGVLMESI